ncbi:cell motility mediator [Globomyces pollinis-pini]|nr:cell motility mediator [Globomyces pollinis-pini]
MERNRITSGNTRKATHSGSWYSDDAQLLDKQLHSWLENAIDKDQLREKSIHALIAPHAGFSYSAKTAGFAYSLIDPDQINTIFLLGPSHKVYIKGCALSKNSFYATPLGNISVDREITEKLKETGLFEEMSFDVDENEHSLELHLPFIHKTMSRKSNGNYSLVPILVGRPTKNNETQIAQLLLPYLQDPKTLFIVSSDFCHWGSRFDFTPMDSKIPIHQYIKDLDKQGMELIERLNYKSFSDYLSLTGNTICGRNAILLLLKVVEAKRDEYEFKFVKYDQSSQVTDKRSSSVSYAAGVLFSAENE